MGRPLRGVATYRPIGLFCRAHVHLLFNATPSDPAASLIGGSKVTVYKTLYGENSTDTVSGHVATYETHLIPPTNRSQVFTMDWSAFLPPVGVDSCRRHQIRCA